MKELDSLENFPFAEARFLVGCADLGKIGLDMADAQAKVVPVERIISAAGALSWRDTLSSLPGTYIEALIKGETKQSNGSVLLIKYKDVYVAHSLGWGIALAKLQGLKEIEALILCYD